MKLTFFYPTKSIGGAQLLFARLAEYYASRAFEVRVIDYVDGYMRNYLEARGVHFGFTKWNDGNAISTQHDEHMVIPFSEYRRVERLVSPTSCKFLLWAIHPDNVLAFAPVPQLLTRFPSTFRCIAFKTFFPFTYMRLKKLSSYLEEKNAIAFMDGPNLKQCKLLGLFPDYARYLPIPYESTCITPRFSPRCGGSLNFCWLGRIDNDKWPAIKLLLDLCSIIDEKVIGKRVVLHLVGSGNCVEKIQGNNSKCSAIVHHGVLEGDILTEFLLNNIDIGFAMGTSALEIAGRGIPTVLLEISRKVFDARSYRFKWLHLTEQYSLGEQYDKLIMQDGNRIDLRTLISLVDLEDEYSAISMLCHSYVKRNHDLPTIADELVDRLYSSEATFAESSKIWRGR